MGFSFHVLNENYRKAASMKYESSLLLADSAHFGSSYPLVLKKRHDCLLVAKHCLTLAHYDNQWLVHPTTTNQNSSDAGGQKKLCIKEVSDISKEILLCD